MAEDQDQKPELTMSQIGKMGGATRKAMLGPEGYSKLGKEGGKTTRERHGLEHYNKIGKMGGKTTSERYGPEFYEQIGKQGGKKIRDLIAKGKELEAEDLRND